MRALLRIALRNLLAHRESGLLLILVMAGASAVLVGLRALHEGVASSQREAVTTLLAGDLNVGGYFKAHPDALAPVIGDVGAVRAAVEPLRPPGCQWRERGRGHATVGAGRERTRSYMVGVDIAREPELGAGALKVTDGALASLARPRTMALSSVLAERLKVRVGDLATLYGRLPDGRRNALDVEVAAITGRAGLLGETAGILVSNATLRELGGYRPESAGVLQWVCDGDVDTVAVADRVRQALRDARFEVLPATHEAYGDKLAPLLRQPWTGQRLDVTSWEDESSFLSFVTAGLAALTVLVGLGLLSVVITGLFVSLSVAVRERTREIGSLRAMGMQRRSVVALFVLEGLLLGFLASTAGAALSAGLCALLGGAVPLPDVISDLFFSPTLPLEPRLADAVLAVSLVTVCAGLASIIPAFRAAALSPRSAMESLT
jgi:putative ABC transport system permease protein